MVREQNDSIKNLGEAVSILQASITELVEN